jgi:hypothetical protein
MRVSGQIHFPAIELFRKLIIKWSDELHGLYSSPNIVRVIKSRRMRWARHVARMEEGWGVYKVWIGRPEGKKEATGKT